MLLKKGLVKNRLAKAAEHFFTFVWFLLYEFSNADSNNLIWQKK